MEKETEKEEIKKQEVKCPKCKYIWKTKTKFFYVTCPKCYYKVKLNGFPASRSRTQLQPQPADENNSGPGRIIFEAEV